MELWELHRIEVIYVINTLFLLQIFHLKTQLMGMDGSTISDFTFD